MTHPFVEPVPDRAYPADPYPGTRPPYSFVHLDGLSYPLEPDPAAPSRWRLGSSDLDDWLAEHHAAPLSQRLPVLAYGSNVNPSKITWLRDTYGLTGPVVVIRARTRDLAAVWSAGYRARDHQRPAVLAAMPGIEEQHAAWLATPEQRRVLDACEGRGQRYRLAWLHTSITLDGDTTLEHVLAYTARPEVIGHTVPPHLNRSPLLVNGHLIRTAEADQHTAAQLTGTPAHTDGLNAEEITGEPH